MIHAVVLGWWCNSKLSVEAINRSAVFDVKQTNICVTRNSTELRYENKARTVNEKSSTSKKVHFYRPRAQNITFRDNVRSEM